MYRLEDLNEVEANSNEFPIWQVIDLNDIPTEKLFNALKFFSEGSKPLECCLTELWKRDLRTQACCAGATATVRTNTDNHASYGRAFITMEPEVDIFGFLSQELLDDPLVVLKMMNNVQVIRFAGGKERIENNLEKFAQCIKDGKKDNKRSIEEKIGKDFPYWVIERYEKARMLRHGYSEEAIEFKLRGEKIKYIRKNGTLEEKEAIEKEYQAYREEVSARQEACYEVPPQR